ncbi:MFS transporter [Chitinophagaceae bacterium LB-8]|jgi:glycoside/pentoside/hexuronide:cation symporter, GPH family|uniref:MFS transporter n=1 Tax=Paraflavisolibacter caeni TaxID=2982496 RepID=A0A9X3B849_9BACT|nr:MFS transporter [Paraflavisolibacter caeni]MCU7550145.1 MFS transporter [Paraflavisolibacter caeni]
MSTSAQDISQTINAPKEQERSQKLSVLEKVGYSLGDLAANLIFQTLMAFLAFFYTDIYKIPPAKASLVMLVGGVVGACFNLVMGAIADRTNTRWGKFRPWVLWTAIPFGVISLLAFSTPNFSEGGKVAYAFITYFLLVIVYSANNLPYSALSGVLTGDMKERNSLSSYRFVAVMVAQFIIQVLLLPLALSLGHGDKAKGFEQVMLVFSLTGVVCFLITFLTTRERITPPREQKTPVSQDLKDLVRNKPWLIMLALTVMVFITLSIKGGMNIFYYKYYLTEASQTQFLDRVGFNSIIAGLSKVFNPAAFEEFSKPGSAPYAASSFTSAFSTIAMILGIFLSKPLADRFGKRNIYGVFLTLSALCLLVIYFYSNTAVMAVFLTQTLHGFIYGVTIPLLWAMIADVADYSEWKNNRRATAIIFSAMIFGLKIGLSVGGALSTWLLSIFGYQADTAVQTASATNGIKLLVSTIPGLIFIAGAILLFWYSIDKQTELQLERELKQRRK